MSEHVIQTHQLTKYFGAKKVVSSLNLAIPHGKVFGFLGRNGSGKSTTIRIILGLLQPTRGSSTILGYDSQKIPPEARARIGYMAEGHRVYNWMTVSECGKFQASFYPKWNHDIFYSIVKHFRLDEKAKAGDLSRGQRAGLCLALTLAPEPELLILDDPVLGLDPVARRSLLESMFFVMRSPNRTILFSSHLLSDVEKVADRIAILDYGVLRANCSVDTFRKRVRQIVLKFKGNPPTLPEIPGLLRTFRSEKEISLTIANYDEKIEKTLQQLPIDKMETISMSLEDAFVEYVSDRGEKTFFLKDMGVTK